MRKDKRSVDYHLKIQEYQISLLSTYLNSTSCISVTATPTLCSNKLTKLLPISPDLSSLPLSPSMEKLT